MTKDSERHELLQAILAHAPFDGWTDKALKRAASDAGISLADMRLLFPSGARGAIELFEDEADRAMLEEAARLNLSEMKIRERIAALVKARIMAFEPNREAARRASLTLALPGYHDLAAKTLYRTVDLIWQAAGDRATDWNFYTKRMILSGVYASTLLFWFSDQSEAYADTWQFLDRRIADVMQIEKAKAGLRDTVGRLPSPARILGRFRHRPIRAL